MSLSFMDTFSALVSATYAQVYEKYISAKRDIKGGVGGGPRFSAFGVSTLRDLDHASMKESLTAFNETIFTRLLIVTECSNTIYVCGKRTSAKHAAHNRP